MYTTQMIVTRIVIISLIIAILLETSFLKYLASEMSKTLKFLISAAIILVSVLLGVSIFRIAWVDVIDNYEIGYQYDLRNGVTSRIDRRGYVVTPPFLVKVHTVDLRPVQVCINANQRVLNCMLVQFDPKGLDLFLSWHGRNDYSIGDSSSTSSSASTFADILKSYAYDGNEGAYPFLIIKSVIKPAVKPLAVKE